MPRKRLAIGRNETRARRVYPSMLPLPLLIAPPAPMGTTTMTVLCEWLTLATGKRHAPSGALRDYPVFLNVRSGEPGRIRALVATAMAGEWMQDGATIRLMPVKPTQGEGEAEFARGWAATTKGRANLAALPPSAIFGLRAGEIARFGTTPGLYVRPLPETLRRKAEAGEGGEGWVYVRRSANGNFDTRTQMPDETKGAFSSGSEVAFRSLPPEVFAALGDEAGKTALSAEDVAALKKVQQNPGAGMGDAKTLERADPLARFMDPLLRPLAQRLKRDLVVALPDMSIMATLEGDKGTVGAALGGFCQTVDWTLAPEALVGRLPVSERRYPTQARRSAMGEFIRRTRGEGVPSSGAVAAYVASQRPGASESWSDAMLLVLSGVVLDESNIGDYPYNLRLAGALTPEDWVRLRSGRPLAMRELSAGARNTLSQLMVQSRERLSSSNPDPVRWAGFPNVALVLTAKIEDEKVVLESHNGLINVTAVNGAGYMYRSRKAEEGEEPTYHAARRRRLRLDIGLPGEPRTVETGFADVTVEKGAKAGPWTALPPEWRAEFETAMKGLPAEGARVPESRQARR